eukprot:TRINITY_DN15606_c0_g2_i3.p1 TRINITY_DN15606_c0_g2~~TRINITY_DN15606_c0_g2_i3.p1  ORF type:complete len:1075 (+),score=158.41 TRINITY_DN15606_c0_g2_i3:68-3292(+)
MSLGMRCRVNWLTRSPFLCTNLRERFYFSGQDDARDHARRGDRSCRFSRGFAGTAVAALAGTLATAAGVRCISCETSARDDELIAVPASPGRFDAARWSATLSRIKDGIVALKITSVRAFDTHHAGSSQATGFVVDAKQGLILTNRHVVTEGPVIAEALFDNHEQVEVDAIYRDPVHDFGIFRYDPARLERASTVVELVLRPDKAQQGLDVRVIGNNAGEKLSVLGAMLARLDREAPFYGRRTCNDFNTFYYQAASATSGGSSGSPVVNAEGDVVALNAAGKAGTSASFYLPLHRVKRAVDLIRAGKPVPRGTFQTTFVFTPFPELRRMGLTPEEAAAARAHGEEVGMLVVRLIVPRGPASGLLEPGDILISLAGQRVTRFVPLEAILDDSVGEMVELCVERGGKKITCSARVQDLHSITPHEYLECGDAVFNNLSYQQARTHNLPVEGLGVYVASQGYMLCHANIPSGSLILQVGDQPTRNVRELEAALSSYEDGTSVPVHCMNVSNLAHRSVAMVRIDRTWFPMQLSTRDVPTLGHWHTRSSTSPSGEPLDVERAKHAEASKGLASDKAGVHRRGSSTGSKIRFPPGANDVERKLSKSLVKVHVSVPLAIDGIASVEFVGTGMIVDAERGLVVCDRNTAPGALCDVSITFGSSYTVPAACVYIHPLHNLAVLSYDTRLVSDAGIDAVKLKRTSAHELEGQKLWHLTSIGSMRTGCRLVSDQGVVTESEPNVAALSHPPRWQETNIDLLAFRSGAPLANCQDGVICNDDGEVVAYWASFLTQIVRDGRRQDGQHFSGITCDTIIDMLNALREGSAPVSYALGAETEKLGLSAVRGMLMDDATTEEVEAKCKHWPPQVMSIRRRWAGTDAHKMLCDNDILLEINGQHIETFRDIELAMADAPRASLLVVRGSEKLTVDIATAPLEQTVTDRVLIWCGAVLQAPPHAVAAQRGQLQCGVYVSSRFHGSPAAKYNLPTLSRIVEVNGNPVENLDGFQRAIAGVRDGEDVRVKQLDLRGAPYMTCVRVNTTYWPTAELRRVPGPRKPGSKEPFHWQRITIPPAGGRDGRGESVATAA